MTLQSDLSVSFEFGFLHVSGCFSADAYELKTLCGSLPKCGDLPRSFVNAIRNCIAGKYIIELTRETEKIWINDLVSSYRHYIFDQSGDFFSDFNACYEKALSIDNHQLKRIYDKGYTQGHRTIFEGISKFHPAAVYYERSKRQVVVPPLPSRSKITSGDLNQYYLSYFDAFKNSRVGIAFSGGLDSLYLVYMCLNAGIQPVLYHLNLTPNDRDACEDLSKALENASLLNIPLNIIQLDRETIVERVTSYLPQHINDISFNFVALREFVSVIDQKGDVDVILTGQNSDSFINFGVTRAYHPIEALLLYYFKKIFRKLFDHDYVDRFSHWVLKIGYFLRRIPLAQIPMSKVELVSALESDYHYFPCLQGDGAYDLPVYEDEVADDYFQWMLCNKLTNHIGGNHSVVWSDDRAFRLKVLMPFSEGIFLQMGLQQMASMSAILRPKRLLEEASFELGNAIGIVKDSAVYDNELSIPDPQNVDAFADISALINNFISKLKNTR